MQKPSPFPVSIFLIAAISVVSCLTIKQSAKADAAPGPDPTVSSVVPYHPQKTKVQMMSETVLIEVLSNNSTDTAQEQTSVQASFTMQNQGKADETMQVVFPLTNLDGSMYRYYDIIPNTFVAKVNGQTVPITEIATPPDLTYTPTKDTPFPSPYSNVLWAAFDVTFPTHKIVTLEVEYKMRGFTGIEYILQTGAGWYGNILSADIILKFPYPATDEIIESANPGYVFSGNEMRWKMENFEPTWKDNLYIHTVQAFAWQHILDLRSKLEHNPDDAETWYELGNEYQNLAFRFIYTSCEDNSGYTIKSQYFADLSVNAYEKAIAIRPNWGDVHFQLARILWFRNKNVENAFNKYLDKTNVKPIKPEDDYVQQVIKELQIAWSYGVAGENARCETPHLLAYLNSAMPDLKLTAPATETITPAPPTETPFPTSTAVILPTSTITLPTQVPASKYDSSPSTYNGFVIGLIILIGISVYLWVFKIKIRK